VTAGGAISKYAQGDTLVIKDIPYSALDANLEQHSLSEVSQPRLTASRQHVSEKKTMNRQTLGFIGAAVLFVGVFMPILSLPLVGSINYFQNGNGDGAIVLCFALLALFFVVRGSYRLLWIPGAGSLSMLAVTFTLLQVKLSEMKAQLSHDLAGNPFRGIADAMAGTVQLQWGWAVLVMASVILLIAAFTKEKQDPVPAAACD
jgi:hypothetical protein